MSATERQLAYARSLWRELRELGCSEVVLEKLGDNARRAKSDKGEFGKFIRALLGLRDEYRGVRRRR